MENTVHPWEFRFSIGQAKVAILKSHKCKIEGENIDLVGMFKSLVKYRVVVENAHCK